MLNQPESLMTAPLAGHHIAVLLGGLSSEREVSLVSGRECADALERLGATVTRVDAGRVQDVQQRPMLRRRHRRFHGLSAMAM